ncbi:MAG: hypothetical protein JOZ15_18615, partial [Acidobacteria bacterium]|nr:hypothetical protein [Acidobacteriota bacterium]
MPPEGLPVTRPEGLRWVPAPVPAAAADLESCGFPPWLAALLARRGVADRAGAGGFLEPSLDQL